MTLGESTMMNAVFIVYVALVMMIAYFARRQSRPGLRDFLTSSRDHGTWLTALSASASSESGWVLLGESQSPQRG